jgi:DNA-binding LacI/PurR family transcriptional regulator
VFYIVTLSEVAKKAGVHVSTVSKALNNSADLNIETKSRIKKIAKGMNYVNVKAAVKSGAISYNVGLICPEIKSNYYAQLVSIIEKYLKQNGYSLVIGFSNFEYANEVYYLSHFAKNDVAGIIYITEDNKVSSSLKNFKIKFKKPLIVIATKSESHEFDCIRIDDKLGIQMVINYMIKLGHKRIAYIGDYLSQNRLDAFIQALGDHDLTENKRFIKVSNKRFEECGFENMKELLNLSILPTAVFCAYDDIALGAMRAIYEAGLRIPDDISISGIDNIDAAPYLYKKLTTVSYPISDVAETAVEILLKKISNKKYKVVKHISIKPELLIRESTSRLVKDNHKFKQIEY